MAKVTASYSKSSVPDGVQFKVTPATSPDAGFSLARLILSGMAAFALTGLVSIVLTPVLFAFHGVLDFIHLGFVAGFVAMALYAAIFLFVLVRGYKWFSGWVLRTDAKVRHAYDVDMLVNADGISVAGTKQFLPRQDIHRLVLKNGIDTSIELPMTNMAVAGNALTVGTMVASNAINNGIAAIANAKRRAAAAVSYQVSVEAGGVSHTVAGGLTEVCAYGLMTDIDRALNT
jgi:hypothetical protein